MSIKNGRFTLIEIIIVVVGILIFGSILFSDGNILTDNKTAHRILYEQGYTDIQITGYEAWACKESDNYSTGFVAKNKDGKMIRGVVCSSWLDKYATIRFK